MPDGSPEIFHTIQGEGRNIGMPSVFIRASLCNLHCTWCDTDYTWNWDDTDFPHEKDHLADYRKYRREDMIITLSADEVVEQVGQYQCPNYVLTGGEPLLQEKGWIQIMKLLGGGNHFEIETNGTLMPGGEFIELIDQFNVSPKLANSGVPEDDRRKPDILALLAETGKADFKFVVHSEADLEEVQSIVTGSAIPSNHVFLMPRASTPDSLAQNQGSISELALKCGFRYSDRLHLRLYGAKRGV